MASPTCSPWVIELVATKPIGVWVPVAYSPALLADHSGVSQSVRMPARHTRGTAWASGHAAGRKRRSSGPRSAISQHACEIYAVDHWLYFRRRADRPKRQ